MHRRGRVGLAVGQCASNAEASFAKNSDHADFIAERFNVNYPQYKGHFARVVTCKTEYAQSIIDDFSNKEKMPHIAVSVDMLDKRFDMLVLRTQLSILQAKPDFASLEQTIQTIASELEDQSAIPAIKAAPGHRSGTTGQFHKGWPVLLLRRWPCGYLGSVKPVTGTGA